MAFVFRSPRIINLSQIESNKDPLPKEPNNSSIINSNSSLLSKSNKSHKVNAPFGVSSKKTILNDSKEDFPGPGSYEITSNLLIKRFNKNETSPLTDDSFSEKNKRLFISKEDRLNKNQYETDVPGPGKYFSDKNKKIFNVYKTLNKRSKWIKAGKGINYETFSTSRILSIPSKGVDFGYKLNNNGELILLEDPEKDYKYLGVKDNSIGPGQYHSDTYNKKNTKIGIIDWNKSLSRTKNKKKKNKKDKVEDLSQYYSSNYFYSNSTEPTTNNNSISIINYNNKNRTKNYFYNGWDLDRKNFEIKFSNNKIYKNDTFSKTINKSLGPFCKPDLKPNNELDIETDIKDDEYYFSLSSFSPKTVNENQQFFGSTLSRGIMFPKSKINDNNIFKRNKNNILDNKINIVTNTLNLSNGLNSSIKKNINSKDDNKKNKIIIKKIDKSELIREISKSLKKDYLTNIGPGSYEPKLIRKNNFSYEIGNFGSLERRFPIYERSDKEGGVLSYIYLDTWGPKKRTNYLKKVIPENIIKKLNEGISVNKMSIFREKIMSETRKQPPLGSYDLDNINTIKSKINYNVNSGKNLPPFGTSSKRILIEGQMKKDENIGNKGHHNQKKDEKSENKLENVRQNLIPFLSNTRRDDLDNFEKDRIAKIGGKIGGPGYYNVDSYFDWHKKSYNILFN